MNVKDLARIFYSNYQPQTDWVQLEEILWMFDEGLFKFEEVRICSKLKFLKLISSIENGENKEGWEDGDSITHQALKLLGAELLSKRFQINKRDILFERPFIGFEVDVIDLNKTLPIECGDTNAIKLERYLIADGVKQMIIIPYPHGKDVSAFIFTARPKFKDYVLFKRDYLRRCIRKK